MPRRTFTTTDGVRLSVIEAGSPGRRPAIAFVPGWSMPASLFRPQLAALGTRHYVMALDPRGQGESDVPTSGYTAERRATDIKEFLGDRSRVVLVGWSLGVLESLQYIDMFGPGQLAGLVLVDNGVGEDPAPTGGGSGNGFVDKPGRIARSDPRFREGDLQDAENGRRDRRSGQKRHAHVARQQHRVALVPVPANPLADIVRAFPKPVLYVVTQSTKRRRTASR